MTISDRAGLHKSEARCGCGGVKSRYAKWCRECQKKDTLSRLACAVCGARRSRESVRCQKCRDAALKPLPQCQVCGKTIAATVDHARKRVYCSVACMGTAYRARMKAADNPNFKAAIGRFECPECGRSFESFTKTRKFCSRFCQFTNTQYSMRLKARKDENHDEIVAVFQRLGCVVLDLSREGRGIPDLFVKCGGEWHPVEIKNPKSAYGKAGLNSFQQKFQQEVGCEIPIVKTADDAVALHRAWIGDKS